LNSSYLFNPPCHQPRHYGPLFARNWLKTNALVKHMTRILLSFAFAISFTASLFGQGFHIEGQVRGLRDTTVTLAHFFGHSQYIPKAKARPDSTGRFVFSGPTALPGGLYVVLLPKGRIELVLNGRGNRFSFVTDTVDVLRNLHVTGSVENQKFIDYQKQRQRYATDLQAIELQAQFRGNDPTARVGLRRQAMDVQTKLQALQKEYMALPDSLLMGKLLRASAEPPLPKAPKTATGKVDTAYLYRHYKNHFWDSFDFADDRLVRTPIFQRKIDQYLQEMTPPTVDSLAAAADLIVRKARANREVLNYAIWYITSQYERPRTMGTDGLFVHMAETYYLKGEMPSADSATLASIRNRLSIIKPLLLGKPFPALSVSDTARRPLALDQVRADYTVVFFYDPTCAHCREVMPRLKQFATDSIASKGVQFAAIAVDNSPDAWQKFIREWGIQQWHNGYDFSFRTDYRRQFDVLKTPTVYVLDKNKTIIARALPAEQVGDFIRFSRERVK
jgi:thiol-disulfide isomerase/thioredoxin